MTDSPFKKDVLQIVKNIPKGEWISYGDVALLAQHPRAARAISAILKSTNEPIPWHRVVNKQGQVSIKDPELRREQIKRLRDEGLTLTDSGQIVHVPLSH
ncbi:O(6)-alkylguanine repair protein YbaZ [Streptohalobacillus salinus]|uniref:O(6)-alkylguanine repair protein YbaZ n=1 Tax=Streptohalobacillus salinus TaxID=621096 RepID=A0A2V3WJT2_9BACI|nr:MGMT family protein [Streptohalobacillus salinus]PXW92928.1 O(6)-alkylguanine repair protein YbaZ [Streptohalobacillus salinus]